MHVLSSRAPTVATAAAVAVGVGIAGAAFGQSTQSAATWLLSGLTLPLTGLALVLPSAVNAVCSAAGKRRDADTVGRGDRGCRARGRAQRRARRMAVVADVLLLMALATGAATRYVVVHGTTEPDHVGAEAGRGHVTLLARVLEVRHSTRGANVVVEALSLADPESPRPEDHTATGLIWVTWPDESAPPARGDVVTLAGTLSAPAGCRNPGAFDFSRYLRHRSIHVTMTRCRLLSIEPRGGPPDVAAWIHRTVPLRVPGLPGEVMRGLLLGTGRALPEELTNAFRRAGTVHVLAVSGLHVGFIVLMVHALLRTVRVPRKAARLLVLPALVGFVLVVGPRPSVVRAAVMAAFLLISSLLERRTSTLNALGAAATALMLVRPGCLFDLGFQLSFSAVSGILLLHGPLKRIMAGVLRPLGSIGPRLAAPLALSLSAQTGVAPVLVRSFGELSIVSPLANLAAVPLAGLSVASGIAMLLTEPMGTWPASAFASIAWGSCSLMTLVTESLGNLPLASVRVATRFWPCMAAGAAGCCLCAGTSSRTVRLSGTALLVIAVAAAGVLAHFGPARSYARVVFFDVGQGDATLLELPGRSYVLVDAGPGSPYGSDRGKARDAGRTVVLPYLRREAIGRLSHIVVTHAHADHFGGVASLLRSVKVDTLVLPDGRSGDPRLVELVDLATQRGAFVREVGSGDILSSGGSRLAVLWPEDSLGNRWSENDRSIVLAGEVAGWRVLLTGDIEARAEGKLIAGGLDVSAALLKAPHHGSATSSSAPFARRVDPALSVIQVGARNRYGHPDDATLRRLADSGSVARTDRDGAVVVNIRSDRMEAQCVASGRSWIWARVSPGPEATCPREPRGRR